MTTFTVTIQDEQVRVALNALASRVQNMQPVLQSLGEDIVERAKHRFDTSTGPDGVPWKPNSPATLAMLAANLGKRYRKKGGDLNSKGAARIAGKKPLIGESKQLRTQIVALANATALTVGTTSVTAAYAAIQQFGGKAGRGHKVTIPARPFLPVHQDGTLYPQEQALILQQINEYLMDRL